MSDKHLFSETSIYKLDNLQRERERVCIKPWEVHWKFDWLDSPSCLLGWQWSSCSLQGLLPQETSSVSQSILFSAFADIHNGSYNLLSLFLLFLVPQMASDSLGLLRLLLTVHSPRCENSNCSWRWRFTFWMTEQVEWGTDMQQTGAFLFGRMVPRGLRWRGATSGCSVWPFCRFSAFSLYCLLCVLTWTMKWELEETCWFHILQTFRQLERSAPKRQENTFSDTIG